MFEAWSVTMVESLFVSSHCCITSEFMSGILLTSWLFLIDPFSKNDTQELILKCKVTYIYESIPLDVQLLLVSVSLSHDLNEVVTLCFTCSYRLGISALLKC